MGKRYSKQAWISREGPEGDCVIENGTTNSCSVSTSGFIAEELSRAPSSHTANFTYKGYPVNLEWPFDPEEKELPKKSFYYEDYPLEVVELPDLPDGKNVELTFEREGLVEASTQTKPLKESTECGMSVKSVGSDHQEWSYTLYDFEGQGQVTRDDLKNLVQSIYEVLGKSVTQSRNQPKDPLKKLRVRLSVSKERGKENKGEAPSSHHYMISATSTQENNTSRKNSKTHIERCDSMTVNPPSLENIIDRRKMQNLMREAAGQMETLDIQPNSRKTSCKKCDQSRLSRPPVMPGGAVKENTPIVNERGAYNCPKRMQTGPGECNPPSPKQTETSRVKDWVEQICTAHELERSETRHRHKKTHRQHVCKEEPNYDLHRCTQYLDLATDHITYPYHVQSHACLHALPPAKPQRRPKRGHHHSCKYSRDDTAAFARTVVHRHEHHHHHSHHHYHHYAE